MGARNNAGYAGNNSSDYLFSNAAGNAATIIAQGNILNYVSLTLGINNLRESYNPYWLPNSGPACCLNLSLANCQAPAIQFKNDYQAVINIMLTIPNVIIVLVSIADPSNAGAGPDTEFTGWADYQNVLALYNSKIKELCFENNLTMADWYTNAQGVPGYWTNNSVPDNIHPNNQGHAFLATCIEEAFLSAGGSTGCLMGGMPIPAIRTWNTPPTSMSVPSNSSYIVAGDFVQGTGVEVLTALSGELVTT